MNMWSLASKLAAAGGLILLSPMLALAALAILLEDGLPVLFRQERVGLRGVRFQILKLRSMSGTGSGPGITAAHDRRITRAGRFLRRYKIDELPQLWNVVRGEMNLIGARPEVPEFVDMGSALWQAVLRSKPGITDLATLLYRHEEEELARADDPVEHYRNRVLPHKLEMNLRYAQQRSLVSDGKLLVLTVLYSIFPTCFGEDRLYQMFPAEERSCTARQA
jgi:lipopolysaccharide/colanic/teichoic acid biosynthesis glycosyltransferase